MDSFRSLVEQSPDAVIFADCDGVVQLWNRRAEAIFGFAAGEMVGRTLEPIIPERLRSAHDKGFESAIAAGHTKYAGQVMTTRSVRKDGAKIYVDLSFGLVRDAAGVVIGVMATARDCTEAYLARKALQAHMVELQGELKDACKDPGR